MFVVTLGRILRIAWKRAKTALKESCVLLRLKYLQRFQENAPPGSSAWLALREAKYGGRVTGVPRSKRSPHAPEGYYSKIHHVHDGGDRMLRHGYGPVYAKYLKPHAGSRESSVTLMEIGILQGAGLAIWSDLFPAGRIIGLDIDLGYIENSMENLLARGAFRNGRPELYEFDQFGENNEDFFRGLLGPGSVDICIDDASHHPQATISTFRALQPRLSESFVCFIEDCGSQLRRSLRRAKPELPSGCRVKFHGRLAVISRRWESL